VSWPAKFKGGRTIDTPVISLDILPTALDALGVAPPSKTPFDGKSLLPLLVDGAMSHHSELYFNSGLPKGEWAVRQGPWKAHGFKEKFELYNLSKDPSEANDLAPTQPNKARELVQLHKRWLKEMVASASKGTSTPPQADPAEPKLSKEERLKRREERKKAREKKNEPPS
jgi:arylsulfatase A-like enzyme